MWLKQQARLASRLVGILRNSSSSSMSMPPETQDAPLDLTHSPEHPLPMPLTEFAPRPRTRARAAPSIAVPLRQTRSMTRRGSGSTPTELAAASLFQGSEGVISDASAQALEPSSSSRVTATKRAAAASRPSRKRVKVEEPPAEPPTQASSSGAVDPVTAAIPPASPKAAVPETLLADAMTCPVCMCPPSDAAITPCGHVLCGECLFMAVAGGIQRQRQAYNRNPEPQCPVCRARIDGWDGKGGGAIGLRLRTADAL